MFQVLLSKDNVGAIPYSFKELRRMRCYRNPITGIKVKALMPCEYTNMLVYGLYTTSKHTSCVAW